MQATFIKNVEGWQGDARLYLLDKPLEGNYFVVVSAVDVPLSGPETFIFGADKNGHVSDYAELDGSYQGGLSHLQALKNSGCNVIVGGNHD